MTNLVDLETAKRHIRMDEDFADDVIYSKIEQASAIIVDYLKLDDPDIWDIDSTESEEIPKVVEAATLLIIEALFDGSDPLSDTVKNLVHRYRDPALA
jgi:hypothetical protein